MLLIPLKKDLETQTNKHTKTFSGSLMLLFQSLVKHYWLKKMQKHDDFIVDTFL